MTCKRRALPLFLSLSLFSGAAAAQIGSVLHERKINQAQGGFVGPLSDFDNFGSSLAAIGDLNHDGTPDVAVGAFGDDDGGPNRGAIWILFLNPDGSVAGEQKISQTQGGFTGVLDDQAQLGYGMVAVGDLDGDGDLELAATSTNPNKVWILFLNQDGTVARQSVIQFNNPVFGGTVFARDFSNRAIESLSDLDGDGLGDLLLGAPFDDDGQGLDRGALWILRMGADGLPLAAQKISQTEGGFTGVLSPGDNFGSFVTNLGDIDGDGNLDLLVRSSLGLWTLNLDEDGFVRDQIERSVWDHFIRIGNHGYFPGEIESIVDLDGDGVRELTMPIGIFPQGAMAHAYLRPDGEWRERFLITSEVGGLGELPPGSYFGSSPTLLGDLNGDGNLEIAVGAAQDGEVPMRRGAIWILTLDPSSQRNGSGVNPENLDQRQQPRMGAPWELELDCTGNGNGVAVISAWGEALQGVATPFGELLVDLSSASFFILAAPHVQSHVAFDPVVPVHFSLIDQYVHLQGVCTGAPGPRLSNALDVIISE